MMMLSILSIIGLVACGVVAVVAFRCCDRMTAVSFDYPGIRSRVVRFVARATHPVRIFYVAICSAHTWVVLRILIDGYQPTIEHVVGVCSIAGLLLATRRKVWPRRAGLDAEANQASELVGRR